MNDGLNEDVMNLPEYETVKLKGYITSNKAYDIIKALVTLYLPGLGTLYYSLAEIWQFGGGEQVLASCGALAIFLGIFLKVSDRSYNNSDLRYAGNIVTGNEDGKPSYMFEVNTPLEAFEGESEVKFKMK